MILPEIQREERGNVNGRVSDEKRMVECHYNGAVIMVPLKIFLAMTMRTQYDERRFVRYKEGAKIYGMSEREFNKLAHDARAVYKRNKMALVKLDIIDRYLEYFRE